MPKSSASIAWWYFMSPVTKIFDEAKLFYGSSETGFKYQIQPIEPPENLFNWFHPDIELSG